MVGGSTFVSWLYLTQHIFNEKYAQHILRPKPNWAVFYFTIILSKSVGEAMAY